MILLNIPLRNPSERGIKTSQWNHSELIEIRHVCEVSMSRCRVSPEMFCAYTTTKTSVMIKCHSTVRFLLDFGLCYYSLMTQTLRKAKKKRNGSVQEYCGSMSKSTPKATIWPDRNINETSCYATLFGFKEVAAKCFLFALLLTWTSFFLLRSGELFLRGSSWRPSRGIVCVGRFNFFVNFYADFYWLSGNLFHITRKPTHRCCATSRH